MVIFEEVSATNRLLPLQLLPSLESTLRLTFSSPAASMKEMALIFRE